jgi:prepilin-type N-terminal cleavage/methylation domain-containing protein
MEGFCEEHVRPRTERGMTIIELMIALAVLATGLGGITIQLTGAIATNNKNSRDTTATLLAQMVIEQISGQHVYTVGNITITDCGGTGHAINTTPGAQPAGSGATLKADGTIDFTQSSATLLANDYAMVYVDCSAAGGIQTTYDVRWNVMSVSTNTSSRMITAAARPIASNVNQFGGLYFAIPVNLRSIGAPAAGL